MRKGAMEGLQGAWKKRKVENVGKITGGGMSFSLSNS